jgi:hypothetical protein
MVPRFSTGWALVRVGNGVKLWQTIVYRTRFFGHKFELGSLLHTGLLPGESCLARTAPARPVETRNETARNRIVNRRHDDRHGSRSIFRSLGCRRAVRQDRVHSQLEQLGGELWQEIVFAVGKKVLESDVLPLDPAGFLHSLRKCLQRAAAFERFRARGKEEAKAAACRCRLLRAWAERPSCGRGPAEKRDELRGHGRSPLTSSEFQTFSSEAFASLLSEARKFATHFCLANQHTDQLSLAVRSAVLGNAATLVVFRVGSRDAALLAPEFRPMDPGGLADQEPFTAWLRRGVGRDRFFAEPKLYQPLGTCSAVSTMRFP